MSHPSTVEKLASQILFHKKLYYSGKSILSDAEYDALEDRLQQLSPHHPALSVVGYSFGGATAKVRHQVPMLSLAKTYSVSDLSSFVSKYPCVAMEKFDGMALALEYDATGKLVVASTRGNGKLGENVTEHVFHILSIPKKIQLPPQQTPIHHFEIRGEIYFPLSKFEKYADKFDSFRNAVPGTLGRKEVDEVVDILHCFAFQPYDLLAFNDLQEPLSPQEFAAHFKIECDYLKKMNLIQSLGFHFELDSIEPLLAKPTVDDLAIFLKAIFSRARDYQIDGIVFRVRNEREWEGLGNTSHHPRGSLAFKQAGETAITEIVAIETSIGRSGKITFRAKLKPVFLSGATISYATLHNAEFIEQGNYSVGAQVEIIRSGEVIPAIVRLMEAGPQSHPLPSLCLCGYPLTRQGPDLLCAHRGTCHYKDQEALVHFVASLDILGVSDKIVFKLREAGLLTEPADLYKITISDLLQIEGFAQKSSENILQAIQNSKVIPLAKFLTALGLKRGGAVKCQEVAKKCKTLAHVLQLKAAELAAEKGWAEKSAEDFVNSLQEKYPIINQLLKHVHVEPDLSGDEVLKYAHHPYYGKHICITGSLSKPRDQYKYALEKIGAKLVSGVTSSTDFLVCNEASASAKYKQAQKLGVPVVSEAQFAEKIDD